MIGEIDDAIRALVKASDGIAADVDIALDAPTKDWAARRNAPTVDLFLYDIREDTRRREYGVTEQRYGCDQNTTNMAGFSGSAAFPEGIVWVLPYYCAF